MACCGRRRPLRGGGGWQRSRGKFRVCRKQNEKTSTIVITMDYDRFVGLVHNRARMGSNGEAVAAIRSTLTTLAERIGADEAHDLASQLPREIGYYLRNNFHLRGERFSFREFCERVAARECCDMAQAVYDARCVIEVMEEAVSPGEIRDIRSQLPPDFQPLFEAGSQGRLRQRAAAGGRRGEEGWQRSRGEEERREWRDEPQGGWRGARGRSGGWREEERRPAGAGGSQREWAESESRGRAYDEGRGEPSRRERDYSERREDRWPDDEWHAEGYADQPARDRPRSERDYEQYAGSLRGERR